MSATRFFVLGSSLFRTPNSYKPFLPLPAPPSFPSFPPVSLRLNCHTYTTAASDTVSDNPEALGSLQPHPWPEWVIFVDRLKTKGYLREAPSSSKDETMITNEATNATSSESVYMEMNRLKDPCLLFARDRYDVFKSLSMSDIETVVKGGCPNLFRKTVNSAKRLRMYALLDEGNVCSACNMRGSCDRAYVILKDQETDARTVDIVRILLVHALDPLVISGGMKSSERERVEASARKLLSELIVLSETDPDPALPKHFTEVKQKKDLHDVNISGRPSRDVEMKRGDWMCPTCNFLNFSRNALCLQCKEEGPKKVGTGQIQMREGDWMCSKCSFMNFSRNVRCQKCNGEPQKTVDVDKIEMKKGDWICSKCTFVNFSRNIKCLKCKEEGPKRVSVDDVEMKKGDWTCSKCAFMNFANNSTCLRCRESRPKKPGEWECPSCNFFNFARKVVCLKCNCERPKQTAEEYEEQFWRGALSSRLLTG